MVQLKDDAILYALSTLAQTCAALAALVGALGLYRLQSLKDQRRDVFDDIYAALGRPTLTHAQVLARARRHIAERDGPDVLPDFLSAYDDLGPKVRTSRFSLSIFEAWNLLVILGSIGGFAHVPTLARQWWTPVALWSVGAITVIVTAASVFIWLGRTGPTNSDESTGHGAAHIGSSFPVARASWRPSTWAPDRWIALCAVVVSACALGLTAWQGYLDREHKRLSVRPHVYVSFDWDNSGAGWTLGNTGLGPAEIRSFSVYVDDRVQPTWMAVLNALGLPNVLTLQTVFYPGDLKVHQEPATRLMRVSAGPASEALKRASNLVTVEVCYCSLYGECWRLTNIYGSRQRDGCDVPPKVIFHAS